MICIKDMKAPNRTNKFILTLFYKMFYENAGKTHQLFLSYSAVVAGIPQNAKTKYIVY